MDTTEDTFSTDIQPCGCCGRTFVMETLVKHERICFKTNTKKRKVFDSVKMRSFGTDINTVAKSSPTKKVPSQSKLKWRDKHEEFISTMRAAKEATIAMKTGAALPPPPKPTINPDYVECPSCSRRFNSGAAERHVPWCKEKQKRISYKSPSGKTEKSKYKPPLPSNKKGSANVVRTRSGLKGSKSTHEALSLANGVDNMYLTRKQGVNGLISLKKRSSSLERKRIPANEAPIQRRSNSGDSRISRFGDSDLDDDDSLNSRYHSNTKHSGRLSPVERSSPSTRTPTPPSSRQHSGSGRRASKFCHECGTRYPVSNAKYCCECGTKRMWLEQ